MLVTILINKTIFFIALQAMIDHVSLHLPAQPPKIYRRFFIHLTLNSEESLCLQMLIDYCTEDKNRFSVDLM